MLDLKMNKLKIIKSVFFSVLIGIMFATVLPNAYSEYSNRMISTIDSPYEISMQYQIRDKSQIKNLIKNYKCLQSVKSTTKKSNQSKKSKVNLLEFSFHPDTDKYPSLASKPKAILFGNF